MDLIAILKQLELFRGLTQEQLADIETITTQETLQADETICQQGAIADKLYIISSGQVEVRVRSSSGSDHSLVYLGAGQIVGEMTLVDAGRRSASIIAVETDTIVYSIPNEALVTLCGKNTAIGYLIMRNIAQDLSFKLRHQDYGTVDRESV